MGPFRESTVIERPSSVAAAAEAVWRRVVTPEGINNELHPVMTMSIPGSAAGMTIDDMLVGTPIGRAWLRPGQSFHEKSTMLSMRLWRRLLLAGIGALFSHRHRLPQPHFADGTVS